MPVNEYASAIIKPILTQPDSFIITQKHDDMGVLLSISVHQADMGLIIGTQGETAKAIRHLVRIVGIASKQRVSIKINEPLRNNHIENE